MNMPRRLPVTLLTGFLGSGKTSLLHKALADPRMTRTAVIINEVGEVGLDHLLLGRLDEDAMLLKSGCLCCSLKNDFTDTLISLYQRRASGQFPPFERVVVETTGLADPVPLLRLLLSQEPVNSWFSVRSVITTVDTLIPLSPDDARPERFRQIALADHLVLTKTDLASAAQVSAVAQASRQINPRAQYIEDGGEDAVMSALLDDERYPVVNTVFRRWPTPALAPVESSHGGVNTCSLQLDQPLPWGELVRFFQLLARTYGKRLLRLKGLLDVEGAARPVVVHGVEHYLFPETYLDAWPDEDRRSRLVFIGENLDREYIEEMFNLTVMGKTSA
ncbi:GTP-binding protein [Pantoea sp. Tr-811]|uniref:CobW family GTP-binding protein n=1 Tax=Pantoea sp. Tr-811 TaxID=2608361 RepID=UPI0014216579|nr:GTP-binding protein [Pantoea sp. Tr-811]NIF28943.1 GTP-binding protein [Pantoea sp. Tr-811]